MIFNSNCIVKQIIVELFLSIIFFTLPFNVSAPCLWQNIVLVYHYSARKSTFPSTQNACQSSISYRCYCIFFMYKTVCISHHLIATHRKLDSVGNHSDEFAVCRLASVRLNGVAEI